MRERFWIWLSWRVPRDLAYWCAIRVGTEAPKSLEEVPMLLYLDALKRWREKGERREE